MYGRHRLYAVARGAGRLSALDSAIPETVPPKALRVEGADNVSIEVWDHGGEGPNLLLVHCTGTHARIWDPLVPGLARHFHVYASSTRGHGDSSSPEEPEAYTCSSSGDDLVRVIDALGFKDGLCAIGHSAGAAHICCAALRRPAVFHRAVLIDAIVGPAGQFPKDNPLAAASRRRRNVFKDHAAARERYASKPPLSLWDPAVLDAYVDHGFNLRDDGQVELKCPGEREAWVYERSGSSDAFERLGELDFKTLIVTGEHSDVMPLAELQHKRMPSSAFHVVPGATHFIPQEKPAEVVQLALDFLR